MPLNTPLTPTRAFTDLNDVETHELAMLKANLREAALEYALDHGWPKDPFRLYLAARCFADCCERLGLNDLWREPVKTL